MRTAAQGIIGDSIDALRNEAAPYYTSAFTRGTPLDTTEVAAALLEMAGGKGRGNKLRIMAEQLADETGLKFFGSKSLDLEAPPIPVEQLHNLKLTVDAALEKVGDNSLGKAQKVELTRVKQAIVKTLKGNDDYARGIEIYEEGMPDVINLNNSIIKVLAGTPDTELYRLASSIFEPGMADATTIKAVKSLIQKKNPEAWNAVIKTELQRMWEKIPEAVTKDSPKGALWRAAVFGSEAKRKVWEAALSPEEFQTMTQLMDVLEATGKVFANQQSITAFASKTMRELESYSAGPMQWVFQMLSPLQVGQNIARYLNQIATGRNAAQLANVITSPDALKRLQQIEKWGPGDTRSIVELSRLLGFSLGHQSNATLSPEVREQHDAALQQRMPPAAQSTATGLDWLQQQGSQ